MVGFEMQCVSEILGRCRELKRRDGVGIGAIRSAHLPGIDPGLEWLRLDTCLIDATARESLSGAMAVGARDGGMRHPDLLVGPAFAVGTWRHRLAKQRPLRAIGIAGAVCEVRRHVPPFDAIAGMRTVI